MIKHTVNILTEHQTEIVVYKQSRCLIDEP